MSENQPATPTETAVVVTVPAAEPVVGDLRSRFDTAAGWGVPAHVTVLYPFVPPDRVDTTILARLAEAVATVPAFSARLTEPRWFGDQALWLAPEPEESFRALTAVVWDAFPDHPPYDGTFDDVVPHLTVADHGTLAELREAERRVRPLLPVPTEVSAVQLLAGTAAAGSWRTVRELPLG